MIDIAPNLAPATYRNVDGDIVEAMRYDGTDFTFKSIFNWLSESGARGQAELAIDVLRPDFGWILVLDIEGGDKIVLRNGDWIVTCDCEARWHGQPAEAFAALFTLVPAETPNTEDAPVTTDRYEFTVQQVIADLIERRRLNIGHYGNTKAQHVLRNAYSDAIEVALFLREQVAIAEGDLRHPGF